MFATLIFAIIAAIWAKNQGFRPHEVVALVLVLLIGGLVSQCNAPDKETPPKTSVTHRRGAG